MRTEPGVIVQEREVAVFAVQKRSGGRKVKTLWAVACAACVIGVIALGTGGCARAPKKTGEGKPPGQSAASGQGSDRLIQEFRMDVLEGAPATGVPPVPQPVSPDKFPVSYGPNYRIGPEDILRISVWENKELTLDVVVRPDGKISVPLIQDVQAEGLTTTEIADVIHQRLLGFIKDPQVSVIVLHVNAPKVFVIGNVARPGPLPLRGDLSVLQALSLAGGFTPFASPRKMKLVRGTGPKQEVRKINYYNLLDAGGEDNYLLKPGDTIVVP
jgi:polysaccharide export outer membrane protein